MVDIQCHSFVSTDGLGQETIPFVFRGSLQRKHEGMNYAPFEMSFHTADVSRFLVTLARAPVRRNNTVPYVHVSQSLMNFLTLLQLVVVFRRVFILNDMHPIKSLLEQQKIGHGECLYTNENRSREIDAFFPPFFSLDGWFGVVVVVVVRQDISLVNERKDRTSSYTSCEGRKRFD